MKLRIAISALLVASLLGFGFSYAVSAASSCPAIDQRPIRKSINAVFLGR